MRPDELRTLLERVRSGEASVDDAEVRLAKLPFEDLGFARVDHHRHLRTGAPEVVYGPGKTAEQIAGIVDAFFRSGQTAVVTRLDADKAELQAYLTRSYGSLTTFNFLFRDEEDRFKGSGG